MRYLHHYTNVDALKSILENKTIRLKPLSTLDDMEEAQASDSRAMGEFIFVSSWSEEPQEMIPMWYMYGDEYKGVRISLPELPFKRYSYTEEQQLLYGLKEPIQGGMETGVPLQDILNESYGIVPTQIGSILHKVEYTDSKEEIYPKLWEESKDGIHFTYGKMGKHKNKYWGFQNELRYIMTVWPFPLALMNEIIQDSEQLKNVLLQISNGKVRCPLQYYDLGIDPQMLDRMQIVLGPLIDEEKEHEVRGIVKVISDKIVVEKSNLKGRIREITRNH